MHVQTRHSRMGGARHRATVVRMKVPFLVVLLSVIHCASAATNVALAIGVSVVVLFFLLFVGIPLCIACVSIYVAMKKRRVQQSSTTVIPVQPASYQQPPVWSPTSAPTPISQPMQEYNPTAFEMGPQATPHTYPGGSYPTYLPHVPQHTTSYAPPQAVFSDTYPRLAPYGEQPRQYSAFPPPTYTMAPPPTGSRNSAGFLPQQ